MEEQWRRIEGWPYEVSNLGRVRRALDNPIGPGRIVEPVREYVRVGLQTPGKKRTYAVHLLVVAAFIGPRPAGQKVNHKDGSKANNRLDNLEYLTSNANQIHAIRTGLAGRGSTHGRAKLTDDQVREIRRRYQGEWGEQGRLAKEYGVSQALITKIVRGEVWLHLDPGYVPKGCTNPRTPKGSKHGRAKLTSRNVAAIRRQHAKGVSIRKIAKRYTVGLPIIRDIAYGKTWQQVQPSSPIGENGCNGAAGGTG